ncbi:nuclear transport factor 2 family protein [Mycobacterium talmoniae]|uniref:Polyketide cyclase n=1 Tax=Mycobacterium talmoniae TaxID=1858794 RepID=A0A1S1ND83_9MYCO|nr:MULTISPECIES: nuclear transport factor 2 family protein [Mycobacterium]OHU97493.1 polyketide cyclase [Mycobacterium talmoniae]PQM49597.1 hypothetical protein C1Y40_00184 [Mycobacterium talmoniae]TDH49701.1 nuclear transport factor 2 family protein [Mycobacterium eburneum]
MTPPVMQRWIELVESGRMDHVAELLAEDPVFYSPAVFTPQRGRETVLAYLAAAGKVFADTDFRYVGQWYTDRSAVLEFTATVDGIYVNGIDMVHWDDDGKIVAVKVMLRPFKALQAIMPKMAALLPKP